MSAPLEAIFQTKYEEFANSLLDTFPELADGIAAAKALSMKDRLAHYKATIMPFAGSTSRDPKSCPRMVLPGVTITPELWDSATEGTHTAINQYLSLMTFTFVMKDSPKDGTDFDFGGEAFKTWADSFLQDWKGKLKGADFETFTKRMADLFGGQDGDKNGFPQFPEKFRKGKLVQLAEEIVRELKPEEFGLDPDVVRQCESDPSKSFQILMDSMMNHPEKIQGVMKRIIKRLQAKFQNGQFKPQDLAAEAEEMMKEFSENPAFVEMMETMKKTFGFEDMDMAKAAGQEPSARMAIVRERLRRKQAAKGTVTVAPPSIASPLVASPVKDDNEFESISVKRANKNKPKK